mgnify:CR=1 FL=1
MGTVKTITVMGATGSIGQSTLALVRQFPDAYSVHALVAGSDAEGLAALVKEFRPKIVGLGDAAKLDQLREALCGTEVEIVGGESACSKIAAMAVDIVVAGIVGIAGLPSVLAAVQAGQTIALANKEALVSAGGLVMAEAERCGAHILPVDSEHNAIFQCLPFDYGSPKSSSSASITKLILTGSGGPFLNTSAEKLSDISVEQACNHPNWVMGQKISIDSATMMNKGLEIIEACHLYDMPSEKVEVVIHPQSIIHSMVEYIDGSVVAQLGTPDMKIPIAYGLGWPERICSGADFLDFYNMKSLSFEKPDYEKFKCLTYAREAYRQGGVYPAILNASNEVAVESFIENKVKFTHIPEIIDCALNSCSFEYDSTINSILRADFECRKYLKEQIGGKKWSI